jgi:uncharacterized protein
VVAGLVVFEVVNSVDNAIVNAHVLNTMSLIWRKRFLFIGIITSVFIVRFLLPLLILWISAPTLSFQDVLASFVGGSHQTVDAIDSAKPIILAFGGVFLLYLYLHWVFLEEKEPLFIERFVQKRHGAWFFAFAALLLVAIMYFARQSPLVMLAAATGSATFFIIYGLRQTAEEQSRDPNSNLSDFSKFFYLEVLDASFSFDGVVGGFAFTSNLLLLTIGLGIGAIVVRQLTIRGIEIVARYKYLRNGALTSVGFLGAFMLIESYRIEIASYIPVVFTFLIIGAAYYWSLKAKKKPPHGKN